MRPTGIVGGGRLAQAMARVALRGVVVIPPPWNRVPDAGRGLEWTGSRRWISREEIT